MPINEPRPGKKLLVLDLDYTLLDFKACSPSLESGGYVVVEYTGTHLPEPFVVINSLCTSSTSLRWNFHLPLLWLKRSGKPLVF
jgi:hypothetical protein